jgi:hypothetical protein
MDEWKQCKGGDAACLNRPSMTVALKAWAAGNANECSGAQCNGMDTEGQNERDDAAAMHAEHPNH